MGVDDPGAVEGARGRARRVPRRCRLAGHRRRAARTRGDGDHRPGRSGRWADHHRRPVPGDEGGGRRVLPCRGEGPRRGARPGGEAARGAREPQRGGDPPGGRARMTDAVLAAVAQAHRREWARVLATTAQLTRDLDLAEECTQDAFAQALQTWAETGIPDRPGAWLTTVAGNRARDALRRESVFRRAMPLLVTEDALPEPDFDDERLRLVFTCCHPALAREAQVALTLRLVCGLSTPEVARAFLVQEATMAARITRAKKKIATARIPYRVPAPDQLGERVGAVLDVVHLIFTTGHTAPVGAHLVRWDL